MPTLKTTTLCEYWCNHCDGSGEIEVYRNEEAWQCGRCEGTGQVDAACSCGKCSDWFAGKVDVELIRKVELVHELKKEKLIA